METTDLDFNLTQKERARALDFLFRRKLTKKFGVFAHFFGPPMYWFLAWHSAFNAVPELLEFIVQIRDDRLPPDFGTSDAIGVAIDVFILGYVIKLTVDWLRKIQWGYKKSDWIGPNGVDWGPVHMTATDDGFLVEREKFRSTLRWPAILSVEENKRTLFLMFTHSTAIIVPKSAFASKAAERTFRDFVEQHVEAAA